MMTDRYEPHCDCLGGHVSMLPDPNGRWSRAEVKPLEWKDFDGRGAKATAMLIASYLITRWSDGRFEISVSAPGYSTGFDGERFHPTLEAAKAAAQADYDRKILARLTRSVATTATLGYDPACPECKGTGLRDSGGTHPWGEPAMMMCDCDASPRAVADDPSGIVQQMPEITTEALEPCPFCGGPVSFQGAAIRCNSFTCNASMSPRWTKAVVGSAKGDPDERFTLAKADCQRRWNRRATEADLRAENERLRAALLAQREASENAAALSEAFRDEPTIPKHLMDQADQLFVRASRLRDAALSPETDGGQDAPADS